MVRWEAPVTFAIARVDSTPTASAAVASRPKDWPTLQAAIDQREFVRWWRENVRDRGVRANVADLRHFVSDVRQMTHIPRQMTHLPRPQRGPLARFPCRLVDPLGRGVEAL
jgi:hypothetical protein